MRSFARRALAVLVVSCAAGCSLFVPLDGLENTVEIADASDASSEGHVTSDGAIFDGGPLGDGSTDDAAVSPCLSPHTFCDDFDTPGESIDDLLSWTGIDHAPPSTLTLSSALVRTPPRAFEATFAPDAEAYKSNGIIHTFASGAFTSLHCELDLRFEAFDTASSALSTVEIGALSDNQVYLDMHWQFSNASQQVISWATYPVDGGTGMSAFSNDEPTFALHTWVHATIDYDATPELAIRVDGMPAVIATLPSTLTNPSNLSFHIGALGVDPRTQTDDVVFDNVFCDVK